MLFHNCVTGRERERRWGVDKIESDPHCKVSFPKLLFGKEKTYYVVAHFHYVLSMGAVFALFAAFYYWIGKISGLQYPETLGQIHFWIFFLGVNITFFPMHFLGLAGMPRRIPDYPDAFAGWNGVASYGSYVSVVGAILFFYVVYKTLTGNEKCAPNPWQTPSQPAQTLEWVLPSPPSFHTFEEIPAIKETKQERAEPLLSEKH